MGRDFAGKCLQDPDQLAAGGGEGRQPSLRPESCPPSLIGQIGGRGRMAVLKAFASNLPSALCIHNTQSTLASLTVRILHSAPQTSHPPPLSYLRPPSSTHIPSLRPCTLQQLLLRTNILSTERATDKYLEHWCVSVLLKFGSTEVRCGNAEVQQGNAELIYSKCVCFQIKRANR